ncbi:MAG: class I SAM-dependent DNA methyltransferase [Oceanicaulis sp.]
MLFTADPDPWNAGCARPERLKRRAILALLGPRKMAVGLELGCGGGVHTADLAARILHLDALDASAEALRHAEARLADTPGVTLHRAALSAAPPRRGLQAVVASEVLYYLAPGALARQIALLRPALARGAVLVTAHTVRRHRDFAQSPQAVERALECAFGPPRRERLGFGWRALAFTAR